MQNEPVVYPGKTLEANQEMRVRIRHGSLKEEHRCSNYFARLHLFVQWRFVCGSGLFCGGGEYV
jgi:hypothetical protein